MTDFEEYLIQADAEALESILQAVLSRYAVLFPDWETATFSLQKKR